MRYRRSRPQSGSSLDFNATPMIDVIFLLTAFFMLVSRFSSVENIPLQIPEPDESQAVEERLQERIVLNCRPVDEDAPERGVLYSIGPNRPIPLSELAQRLAEKKNQLPPGGCNVIIRADRRLPYSAVRDLMSVVAAQEIPVLNVAAEARKGGA